MNTFGIYAIRDRLLDHLMQPFVAPNDKVVLASISEAINNPDNKHAISQAPHHYEIYKLGEVQEDGTLVPKMDFISEASSLIRPKPGNSGLDPTNQGRIPIGREPTGPRSGPVPETAGRVNGADPALDELTEQVRNHF